MVLSCGVRARKALFYKVFTVFYFLSGSVKNRHFYEKGVVGGQSALLNIMIPPWNYTEEIIIVLFSGSSYLVIHQVFLLVV